MPGESRERAGRRTAVVPPVPTAADAAEAQVLEEGGQSLLRTGDEDVQHIMVVLEEELQPNELAPGQGYKITGLDTDSPELELACGSRWKGRYEELMGTTLFFQLGDGQRHAASSSSSGAAAGRGGRGGRRGGGRASAAGGAGGAPATKCTGQTELCIKFRRIGGTKRAAGGDARTGVRPSRQQQRRRRERGEVP